MVIETRSPYQMKVLAPLLKSIPGNITHKILAARPAILFGGIFFGFYKYIGHKSHDVRLSIIKNNLIHIILYKNHIFSSLIINHF